MRRESFPAIKPVSGNAHDTTDRPHPASGGGDGRIASGIFLVKAPLPCFRPVVILAAILLSVPAWQKCSSAQSVDAAKVQRSIDRGIAYLRKQQLASGGWREYPQYSGGVSSLTTLALLNAGVPSTDPTIVSSLNYLRRLQPDKTYSVSLQTMVYCQVGAAADLPWIRRNIKWLAEAQNARGLWGYDEYFGTGDPSNTQFALLALAAAVDRGVAVPGEIFERSLQYWQDAQHPSGGWSYGRTEPVKGSMTCAGIASLIITEGRLAGTHSSIDDATIRCCGGDDDRPNRVEAGLQWMAAHFSTEANPQAGGRSYYYYMYALERAGRLTGRRFVGNHDWYREGAESLIAKQDSFEGFWRGNNSGENNPLIATSFALLFLSKGKRQVVVARLDYPGAGEDDWNRHPDGLRQLVRHVELEWGRDLTWQTINATNAEVEDLLQTPVLVISGDDTVDLSPPQVDRLRAYVDQGGTILFEAEDGDGCGSAAGFRRQVARWCQDWFPDAELEKLPIEHPVWYAERKVDPVSLGDDFWIYGVQACCRTPVFFVPKSLSCRWELSSALFRRRELPAPVGAELTAAVGVGENVIAYATGRELKDKLDQRYLLTGGSDADQRRGQLELAELELGAGGEDARRALPNAVGMIAETLPIAVAAADESVRFDEETLQDVAVLWIHGRTDFELTEDQRGVLESFLRRGGFVIAGAVCGSEAFAQAFRREFESIDSDVELQVMPPAHPALTKRFGGFDLRSVTIRQPDRRGQSLQINRRESHPIIEVARVGLVDNVFFSPLDLSCALESQNSIQCPGYATEDATKILANLLLYAFQQSPE